MKRKLERLCIAILTIAVLVGNFAGNAVTAYAAGGATSIILADKLENSDLVMRPGETKHVRLPVKAVGDAVQQATVSVSSPDSPFSFSQAALTLADQSPVLYLSNYGITYIDFDVTVKETAQIGSYPITVKVSGIDNDNGSYSLTLSVDFQVLKELAPPQITISDASIKDAVIGGETKILFTLHNDGEMTARSTYYSVDFGDSKLSPKYETLKIKAGDLAPGESQFVALPVEVLSTATEGLKTITVNFEYKDFDGNKGTDSVQIYADIRKNDQAPELLIDSISYVGELKAGAEVTVKAVIRNYGASKADNVTVKVDEESTGSDGFLKNYFTDSLYVGGINEDSKIEAKLPLKVSSQATGGTKKVNLIIGYEDSFGNDYEAKIAIYPEVIGGSSSGTVLKIMNVNQTPNEPQAGENMQVAFDLMNSSQSDIADVKIALQGLDGTTFIPANADPYQYIEKIPAGKTRKVTIPLTVSDAIREGLNNLSVSITYAGSTTADPITIPIKNVQNDLGSSSKPKLIISKYITDSEELRAGSTFNFVFDIHNTHSSIAAKNITVTISQADNMFSVTQGSNSFFIDKIAAGETVQESVEMKVKSDAVTKAYPLKVTIEYEYDGIEPNPETGEIGESKVEELNLQAVENSRPKVNNAQVYSYNGAVVVGSAATLSFEFYNMGRSPLNNVTATVEGDYTQADGDMRFIGNVEAGSSQYVELDVIPNVEGTAKGVLKVSFEDSNGDLVEFTTDFSTEVTSATVFDPGMGDGSTDVFNPMPIAKEPILPVALFIIIQLVLIAVFIPVTRKVIISVYKVKLRKKEIEE